MKRSNARRRPGNERCPCGSRRLAKRCCLRPDEPLKLVTLGLPGATGRGFDEGIVDVSPERLDELAAAFHAANARTPDDDCPICALQRRWALEDAPPELN